LSHGTCLQVLQITKSICFIGVISSLTLALLLAVFYSLQQPYDNIPQLFATTYTKNYGELGNNTQQRIPALTGEEGLGNKNKPFLRPYQNPNFGVKIQYPHDWTFQKKMEVLLGMESNKNIYN
jgi:hypothetical protein